MERDARRQQLNSVGHNHSRDSAIDADLQEWETETMEIDLVCNLFYLISVHLIEFSFSRLISIILYSFNYSAYTRYV